MDPVFGRVKGISWHAIGVVIVKPRRRTSFPGRRTRLAVVDGCISLRKTVLPTAKSPSFLIAVSLIDKMYHSRIGPGYDAVKRAALLIR